MDKKTKMTPTEIIQHTWDNNTYIWQPNKLPVLFLPVRIKQNYYPTKLEEPPSLKTLDVVRFTYESGMVAPLVRVHRITGHYKDTSLVVEERFIRIV